MQHNSASLNGSVFEDIGAQMSHLSLAGSEGSQPAQTESAASPNYASQQNAQPEDPLARYRIFVGGISWKATEQDLGQFFSQFGNVIDCKIIFDKVTHKSKGYGFITFDNEESVAKVLQTKQNNAAQLAIFGKAMDVGHAVRRNSPVEPANKQQQDYSGQPSQRGGYSGYGQRQFVPGRFVPGAAGGYGAQQAGYRAPRRYPAGQYDPQAYARQVDYRQQAGGFPAQGYGMLDPQWAGYAGKNPAARQPYWQGQVPARGYPSAVQANFDASAASGYGGYAGTTGADESAAAPGSSLNFGVGQTPGYGAAPNFYTDQ